jgi:hypothetical protein
VAELPPTQIVVIRRDLTLGEYSAQLAHAGEAYLLRRDAEQADIEQSPPRLAVDCLASASTRRGPS